VATWQRYWLFQLPGLGVVSVLLILGAYWFDLPRWTTPFALGLWIVKDLLLYPFLKSAYEGPRPTGPESMVGSLGTATEELCSSGLVRIGLELWRAESSTPVRAGHAVRVIGCDGMTMRVEPAGGEPEIDR
jgi:membrane protein implicated in regulation of membrane protease activity